MGSPKFEERKDFDLAYIEHKGAYDKIPWDEYIPRLYGWAKDQKVMPGFYPMAIYYDDPGSVPSKDLRSDVGITYKGEARGRNGIRVKNVPSMKVVTASFKGPGSDFKRAYDELMDWMTKKGYMAVGPSIEIYSKIPEVVDGIAIIYAKIMIPVQLG